MTRTLLLISNSTSHGEGYLDHCMDEMRSVLGGRDQLVFVPFALHDRTGYGAKARTRFAAAGISATVLTEDEAGHALLERIDAVFVGGGNTFRLLDVLQRSGLDQRLRRRVAAGMVYMGASAGSNIAAPTIRTTNDMPIVQPASFQALGLVPFQINPHYLDADPGSTHMGETREERLVEFLEENDDIVVGLREGCWVRVEDDRAWLGGAGGGARVLRRRAEPEERPSGDELTDLL